MYFDEIVNFVSNTSRIIKRKTEARMSRGLWGCCAVAAELNLD